MKKNVIDGKKIETREEYINSVHRLGRTGGIIAIFVMMSMPIIAGFYFDAMPSAINVITASAGLLAIFVPLAISEVISYTPILGSSIYLTVVTGNVTNLKLPVATNAMKLLNVQNGSEEADVISSIAVSASSILTIIIVAVGVLLMAPLKPILQSEAIQTASNYILPALFGSMALGIFTDNIGGGVRAPGRMKGAILPAIIMLIISILDIYVLKTGMISMLTGVFIIIMLPITYFCTKKLFNKGKIEVILPSDNK